MSMKNWLILFVRTGNENNLMAVLKEKLNPYEYLPFVPLVETSFRKSGVVQKIKKPLFPGYLFIQTKVESDLIADKLSIALKGIKSIYSLLCYGCDKKDVVMRESERSYWERLLGTEFCITASAGFIENERIRVTSGALTGLEGSIKKIDRHKRQAIVEMEMMGAKREVALMLEIIRG
ncbi:hypothetical protein FACS18942_07470 [Planctomycetales bacterium]|nr:hypothetical protein FACS18942_07470 [Planctomycetales bacterium]GHT38550.1 hypothetical protein FACS189427_12720 [Planctomycetales bacterium]